jgi:hypothetical protein
MVNQNDQQPSIDITEFNTSLVIDTPILAKDEEISDYEKQLRKENTNLAKEVSDLKNEFNKYDKINQYYIQDEVMLVYIQKILTILYAVVFFVFLYVISVSDRNKVVKFMILALFATLPFVVHIVTAYVYSTYLEIVDALKIGTVTRL